MITNMIVNNFNSMSSEVGSKTSGIYTYVSKKSIAKGENILDNIVKS